MPQLTVLSGFYFIPSIMLNVVMHCWRFIPKLYIRSPLHYFGYTFLLLTMAPSVFESVSRGTNRVVAGAWFFDLLSLTHPKGSPADAKQQLNQALSSPYQDKQRPLLDSRHWIPVGRKIIRETLQPEETQKATTNRRRTTNEEMPGPVNRFGEPSLTPLEDSTSSNAVPIAHSNLLNQESAICHALTGLTPQQRKICLQHSGLVWAMLEGTQIGLYECLRQFQHEQWNCSAVNILYQMRGDPSSLPSVSGMEGILQRGSREAAFLSSAWSAGVVQAITRACSRGQMATCDCDPQRREGQDRDAEGVFTWGGCSDPIKFGMRLTRLFLDASDRAHRQASINRERQLHGPLSLPADPIRKYHVTNGAPNMLHNHQRYTRSISSEILFSNSTTQTVLNQKTHRTTKNRTANSFASPRRLSPQELQAETLLIMQTKARALMNLHNRRAGRRLIWKTRVRKCKCHGVSGACSVRTCWQRVNEFRHIGSMLKAAYGDAVRVAYDPRKDVLRPTNSQRYRIHLNNGIPSGYEETDSHMIHRFDPSSRAEDIQANWLTPMRQPIPTINYPRGDDTLDIWRRRRWPRAVAGSERVSKGKLIYLEESPNYCRYDPTIGHLGVAGRLCNLNNTFEVNSCARLCCDKGYDTVDYERERKCECKFVWCCEVRCKTCRERIIEHRCRH